MSSIKDRIVEIVTEKQGLKATELAAIPEIATHPEFSPDLVLDLIREKRLVEVEYILPQLSFRIKSFLLPASTRVRIHNNENWADW